MKIEIRNGKTANAEYCFHKIKYLHDPGILFTMSLAGHDRQKNKIHKLGRI